MTLSENPGALKKFRRTPWKFQQTFQTPLKNLQAFGLTIVTSGEPLKSGCLTIEQVVFDPEHLIALLTSNAIPPRYERGMSLSAIGQSWATRSILFLFPSPNRSPFILTTMNTQLS